MKTLAAVLPNLVSELKALLEGAGRAEIAALVAGAVVERYTYDGEVEAGYIRLAVPVRSLPFVNLTTDVAETISFYDERGLNVDITHNGDLFGVEFLGRTDIAARLKKAHAL